MEWAASYQLATVLLIGGQLLSCSGPDKKVDDQANTVQPPVSRELITLQKGKLSTDLRLPGELIAYQQVHLYAKGE